MQRANSLEKTLMLRKTEGRRRRGPQKRRWDGWMASLTQWTWVWVKCGRQWRTGKPGMPQSMRSQRVGHNLATEQQRPDKKLTRGQARLFQGPCFSRGSENKQQDPLIACSLRCGWAGSLYGIRAGECPGVQQEGWLRYCAHPLCWVQGAWTVPYFSSQHPVFVLSSSEVAGGLFFVFCLFVSFWVQNLPQLHMHEVIFSLKIFLHCVALEEVCPGASIAALQQRVPCPKPVSPWQALFCFLSLWVWLFSYPI